ncbi:MAG: RNA polymerase sigma factor [Cyclonatronaceae bacterium]
MADKENKEQTVNQPRTPSSKEDVEFVQEARSGNQDAYRALTRKYERAIYYHINKIVRDTGMVDDLVQETFLKAFNNIQSYDTSFAFSTWLYRIATNHSIDYLRKKKLKTLSIDQPVHTKDGELSIDLPDENAHSDSRIISHERSNILKHAIEILPDRYRVIIQLRHMEEKSYEEIAQLLDLPLGTVKAHIFRARELLYKYLKDRRDQF